MARIAKAVIDNAIEENRANEYLLYLFAVVFVIVGVALIVWAVYRNQPLAALAGPLNHPCLRQRFTSFARYAERT
jgi:hypothetical protein